MLVIYLICKHKHIRAIVASLILHKTKEVEANSNLNSETINLEMWYFNIYRNGLDNNKYGNSHFSTL